MGEVSLGEVELGVGYGGLLVPDRPFRRARAVASRRAGPSVEIIRTSQIRSCVWKGRE